MDTSKNTTMTSKGPMAAASGSNKTGSADKRSPTSPNNTGIENTQVEEAALVYGKRSR
jgi:hypothetical protein